MKVIVRHVKHKSLGTIAAASAHTMRTRPTPNADARKPAPEVWAGSTDPAEDVRRLLPPKRRKNAVLALEYVVTASPEYFSAASDSEWRAYLRDQLEMLGDYYGGENVASAVLHLDEKTPHLAVMIVPLVDGKLNARALIGSREACSIIQDMAGDVGRSHGLLRGQRGSKARHQDVQRFYAEIEPARQEASRMAKELRTQSEALHRDREDLERRLVAVDVERARLAALAASLSPIEEERAAQLHADLTARPAPSLQDGTRGAAAPIAAPRVYLSPQSPGL